MHRLDGAGLKLLSRENPTHLNVDAGTLNLRMTMVRFDADKLNAEFFPDGKWKVNLLCNVGYGDPSKLHPRNPRLNFEETSLTL